MVGVHEIVVTAPVFPPGLDLLYDEHPLIPEPLPDPHHIEANNAGDHNHTLIALVEDASEELVRI